MPSFGPVKRRDLIVCLRRLDFKGPYSGGRHEFMSKGNVTVVLPNPHQSDIGRELLARVLRQAGVSREEWERL
jgi:predicted RNA binding protein YcfA (HicA-like mRNA interferase family)